MATHTHTHNFSFSFFLSHTQTQRQLPRSMLGRIFHLSPADFTVTHCIDSGLLKKLLPCPFLPYPFFVAKKRMLVSKEDRLRLYACVIVCVNAWHCRLFVKMQKCVCVCVCQYCMLAEIHYCAALVWRFAVVSVCMYV